MTENAHDLLNAVGTIRFEFSFLFLVFPTDHNFDCSYLGKHFSWVCNWKNKTQKIEILDHENKMHHNEPFENMKHNILVTK